MEDANGHIDDESRVRTRVSRACTRCRARKDRCDGVKPSCSNCRSANTSDLCTYEPSTKKRGLPEGYVRGLEKLNSLLVAKFHGFEEAVVQLLRDERESLARVWNHRITGEELHVRWKESSVLHELEALLATMDNGPGAGVKRKRDRDDEEDGAMSVDSEPTLDSVLSTTYLVKPISPMEIGPRGLQTQITSRPTTVEAAFILPTGSSDSINGYFQFVHPWLPILDRSEMRKKCYELGRREVFIDPSDAGLANLSAALALASLQVSMIPQAQQAMDATYLYDVSKQCIPFTSGLYSAGHVSALVLLALADISGNRWSQAWTTIGLASRIALDSTELEGTLERQQTATYQACFILDTLIALRMERTPQMRRNQLTKLLIEDGHEEWEPYSPTSTVPGFLISTFNRLTDVFAILNDSICSIAKESQIEELERLSQSYPFLLSEVSRLPPHQLALKASHLAAVGYLGNKVSSNIMAGLQSVNLASGLMTSSSTPVSSIVATALVDAVQKILPVNDSVAETSKRQRIHNYDGGLSLWPADPFSQSLPPTAHASERPMLSTGLLETLGSSLQPPRVENSTAMRSDAASFAHRSSSTVYNGSIATSPSFHGDDIDALFREMAQLDTTEWADGRAQGLGFSDEMTFEAFCNDPDRVFSGNSVQQSTTLGQSNIEFTLPQGPQLRSNFEPYDILTASWNG